MKKKCPSCLRDLPIEAFNFKVRATGVRQPYCRQCSRRYIREHYARNTAYYLAKARTRNVVIRLKGHERLLAYLREHPCVDCGETDPIVLQFDHVDPATKRLAVSLLIRSASSWSTVLTEIAKCEVRCANCHLRRTARQFGWYRLAETVIEEARPTGLEPITASFEG